jgi:hypothetical protein
VRWVALFLLVILAVVAFGHRVWVRRVYGDDRLSVMEDGRSAYLAWASRTTQRLDSIAHVQQLEHDVPVRSP